MRGNLDLKVEKLIDSLSYSKRGPHGTNTAHSPTWD